METGKKATIQPFGTFPSFRMKRSEKSLLTKKSLSMKELKKSSFEGRFLPSVEMTKKRSFFEKIPNGSTVTKNVIDLANCRGFSVHALSGRFPIHEPYRKGA